MNERQRDRFLWLWSRRRTRGAARVARHGALIGAAGGLLFAGTMLAVIGAPATPGLTGLSTLLPVLERAALLALAVPVLAAWGCFKARRVFQMQERMYQSMLLAGARVPTQAPVMQPADHWPMLLVGLTVTVIAGFVLSLMWAAGTGRL